MSNTFMIKVRPADSVREVLELPSDTLARSVDPMVYTKTKKLEFTRSPHWLPLKDFSSYSFVVLRTGFEDGDEWNDLAGHTVVYVDPKNAHLAEERLNHFSH